MAAKLRNPRRVRSRRPEWFSDDDYRLRGSDVLDDLQEALLREAAFEGRDGALVRALIELRHYRDTKSGWVIGNHDVRYLANEADVSHDRFHRALRAFERCEIIETHNNHDALTKQMAPNKYRMDGRSLRSQLNTLRAAGEKLGSPILLTLALLDATDPHTGIIAAKFSLVKQVGLKPDTVQRLMKAKLERSEIVEQEPGVFAWGLAVNRAKQDTAFRRKKDTVIRTKKDSYKDSISTRTDRSGFRANSVSASKTSSSNRGVRDAAAGGVRSRTGVPTPLSLDAFLTRLDLMTDRGPLSDADAIDLLQLTMVGVLVERRRVTRQEPLRIFRACLAAMPPIAAVRGVENYLIRLIASKAERERRAGRHVNGWGWVDRILTDEVRSKSVEQNARSPFQGRTHEPQEHQPVSRNG